MMLTTANYVASHGVAVPRFAIRCCRCFRNILVCMFLGLLLALPNIVARLHTSADVMLFMAACAAGTILVTILAAALCNYASDDVWLEHNRHEAEQAALAHHAQKCAKKNT